MQLAAKFSASRSFLLNKRSLNLDAICCREVVKMLQSPSYPIPDPRPHLPRQRGAVPPRTWVFTRLFRLRCTKLYNYLAFTTCAAAGAGGRCQSYDKQEPASLSPSSYSSCVARGALRLSARHQGRGREAGRKVGWWAGA